MMHGLRWVHLQKLSLFFELQFSSMSQKLTACFGLLLVTAPFETLLLDYERLNNEWFTGN
jgi:hypothetical protein